MIRFLYILLAMVVTIAAFLMQTNWLYFVAFALLVGAVLVLIQYVIERNRKHPVSRPVHTTQVRKPEDELRSHGILEVRPKRKEEDQRLFTDGNKKTELRKPNRIPRDSYASNRRKAANEGEVKDPSVEIERYAPPVENEQALVEKSAVSQGQKDQHSMAKGTPTVEKDEENIVDRIVPSFLEAIKASVEANTVCYFQFEDNTFSLKAIVSDNKQVKHSLEYSDQAYFLGALEAGTRVFNVGEDLRVVDLGYYEQPEAITEVIVTPVYKSQGLVGYIIADQQEGKLGFDDETSFILNEAGRTLGLLLEARSGSFKKEVRPKIVAGTEMSKHRVIIHEEVEVAVRENRPLGLALVYIEEEPYTNDEKSDPAETESWIKACLEEGLVNGRIEHFGEMGYGVFHYENIDAIEEWVETTQIRFEEQINGHSNRLIIGIAMMTEGQNDAENLQMDAARALQEAYETGRCTIIVD